MCEFVVAHVEANSKCIHMDASHAFIKKVQEACQNISYSKHMVEREKERSIVVDVTRQNVM